MFELYLLFINILSFIYTAIYFKYLGFKDNKFFNILLVIFTLAFGSLDAFIAIIIFDKSKGENKKRVMLYKIMIFVFLVIEILLLLIIKFKFFNNLNLNFIEFFKSHNLLVIYLLIINIIAFIAYGLDKRNSLKNKERIPINALIFLALIGGSIGSIISMYLFHHKTNKTYFTIGIPLIILMQIVIIFFIMNLFI